jgi:hypothetical protein
MFTTDLVQSVRNESETARKLKLAFLRRRESILHWYRHAGGKENLISLDTLIRSVPSKKCGTLEKCLGCKILLMQYNERIEVN